MAMDSQTKTEINSKYDNFSKTELIAKIIELEKHAESTPGPERNKHKKRKRSFNWDNVSKRHILLKILYFGWDYQGYVSQITTSETIEEYLMAALKKSCLIENRENSNYHRCGRTDNGVSAFSQVISLDMRSKLKAPSIENADDELPYCKMLNSILPIYIRCYAWAHIDADVSARFDCTSRSYNYFFPRGSLDIDSMREASKHLEGTHDFRNLCKMDVGNGVVEFVRSIKSVSITLHLTDQTPEFEIMKFAVTSKAFLWHQIRCIMGILFLVGEGKEAPSIVAELLDISKHPCKPQYQMAAALPLSLSETLYENQQLNWIVSDEEINYLSGQLQGLWTEFATKGCMARVALNLVRSLLPTESTWQKQNYLYTGVLSKIHIPLSKRPTCAPLEDRIHNTQRKKMKMNEKHES